MKFVVAVVLALAMAANARQLTWSKEQMAAMGYPTAPADSYYVAPKEDPATVDTYYGKPYYAAPKEADPEYSVPYYYGKPYAVPVADDSAAVDPYHGYYVQPTVDDSADDAKDPVACYYKKHFSCDAPAEVDPTCGTETCSLPNLCLTVKKTVKKMIEVPVTECADPKLVCKEIKKECGDTSCAYDEVCKVDKVCQRAGYGYGYGYPVDDTEEDDADKPWYGYEYPADAADKAEPAVATANAVATADGGPASANAKAVANAGSKKLLNAMGGKYPGKYATYAAPEEADDSTADPAYGAYKVVCKDTYSCDKVDPKVCKTVAHEVCVKKDPKTVQPGYFEGYPLDWAQGYEYGQPCGGTVCDAGSFCATCEVEVCKDAVMEKDAAQCGYDAKGVPTFCPAGHMCTELCAPVKKYIAVEVEVPVCVDPADKTYAADIAAAVTACGPHQCLPGYECNAAPVKVCGAYEDPAEEDPAEDKVHGYYFYYDPNASQEDADKTMPGYTFYGTDESGDPSGCGYYIFARADDEDDKADLYYYSPVADDAAADPHYYYYPDPTADDSAGGYGYGYGYGYPYTAKDAADTDPTYYKPVADPWVADKKTADPWVADKKTADPWVADKKTVDPWMADKKTADPWVVDPWVADKPAPKSKVSAVSKSNGDSVYVWGDSTTSGDASGSFEAHASSGDDTKADITGHSGAGKDGKGTAGVDCSSKSADGKVAGCDGTATHN